jgi:hypothetical protein
MPGSTRGADITIAGMFGFIVGCAVMFAVFSMGAWPPASFQQQSTDSAISAPATRSAAPRSIKIRSATYGRNCGVAAGNATWDVAPTCDGKRKCDYVVDIGRLRDPIGGCSKDFMVEYECSPDTAVRTKGLPPEAGFKETVTLECAQ